MIVQPPDFWWWPSPWQAAWDHGSGPQLSGSIGSLTPLPAGEEPPPPPRPIGFRVSRREGK